MKGSSIWSRDDIIETLRIVNAANHDIAQDVDTPEMRIYRKGYEAAIRAIARNFGLSMLFYSCFEVTSGHSTARIAPHNIVNVTSCRLVRHQKDLSQIHRMLMNFDTSELRTLCFDLGVDYDNLPGEGKMDVARELVVYFERHQRLSELIEAGRELRPDLSWGNISIDRIS